MISLTDTRLLTELPFIEKKVIWELSAIDQMIRSKAASGERLLVFTVYQGKFSKEDFNKLLTRVAIEVKRNGFKIGKLAEKDSFMTFLITWEDVCLEIE